MSAPDDLLNELVAEAIDQLLEDPGFDLDAFARAHPEHEAELRSRLARLAVAGLLPGESLGVGGEPESEREEVDAQVLDEVLEALRRKPPLHERYEIRREIGKGGMGRVVEVFDRELRRTLAMKFLRTPSRESARREMAVRFLEEARITAQLDHQGIVPIYSLGIDEEGTLYYTMRLVAGRRTLGEVFELAREEREGWTRLRALGAILRACEAVTYAHRRGVVHRDLKPTNVMVGPLGEVFVVDWGLSKVLEAILREEPDEPTESAPSDLEPRSGDSPFVTGRGRTLGTPYYMPPEQARGDREAVGARSDVYAMGAILYELLAGRPPYAEEGARISSVELLDRILDGPPAGIDEVAPREPAELRAICAKAMRRRPEDRFSSIEELAEDLRAFVEGRVVSAYETGAWAEARNWVRRNKPLAGALAAAMVILIVGLAVSLYQKARADAAAADVLRLAELTYHEELIEEADRLWPPHPELVDDYQEWMSEARAFLADLNVPRSRLKEVSARALPPTDEGGEQAGQDELALQEALRLEIEAKRGAYLQRTERIAVPPPDDLDWDSLPTEASELVARARPLVWPNRTVFGREAEGLKMILRALEMRGPNQGRLIHLSWALFALGRDEEALDAIAEACEYADDEDKRRSVVAQAACLEAAVGRVRSDAGLRRARWEFEDLEEELARRVDSQAHGSLRFPATGQGKKDHFWHDRLNRMIAALEALQHERTGLLSESEHAVSTAHGWSIPRRVRFAERLREGYEEGGEWDRRWSEAIAAIGIHPKYGGLELVPQMGLVPIGPDRESTLWEFWHVATGVEPERGEAGRLLLTEETGLVLVLLPGGKFPMGAQREDPRENNYDPAATVEESPHFGFEGPVHEVELSPFFLSKYELTQGQWARLRGDYPSLYGAVPYASVFLSNWVPGSLLHPVERVSWFDCRSALLACGLALPSEAQWEYGARAGTDTPWFSGAEKESLDEERAANVGDRSCMKAWGKNVLAELMDDWLDDGYGLHAPVGSFAANAFGLHDVVGNAWEWCLDGYYDDFYWRDAGPDPVAPWEEGRSTPIRGGGFYTPASFGRSSMRRLFYPTTRERSIGVRPARPIEP